MEKKEAEELMHNWNILGLSLIMLSENRQAFYALVKQEFGYRWDGQGWKKDITTH